MNRIDKVVVFRTPKREHLEQILDIELEQVQERIMSPAVRRPFVLNCTASARDFLLKEGTDARCGARDLKRSIERHLTFPLSNLLATDQIGPGDLVTTYYSPVTSKLTFLKEDWGALVGAQAQGRAGATEARPFASGAGASGCKPSATGATARFAS